MIRRNSSSSLRTRLASQSSFRNRMSSSEYEEHLSLLADHLYDLQNDFISESRKSLNKESDLLFQIAELYELQFGKEMLVDDFIYEIVSESKTALSQIIGKKLMQLKQGRF